jgi:hypothetical protein
MKTKKATTLHLNESMARSPLRGELRRIDYVSPTFQWRYVKKNHLLFNSLLIIALTCLSVGAEVDNLQEAKLQDGDPVVQDDLIRDEQIPNYSTFGLAPGNTSTPQAPNGQINYTITFSDPGGVNSAYYAPITSNLRAAGAFWATYLAASGNIEVEVEFTSSVRFAPGGSVTSVVVRNNGTRDILEQGVAYKLRTGIDPNGVTPDARIKINPNYLRNNLWFDPHPTQRTDSIPPNRTDAVSVFIHELGHALAFNGWMNGTTGQLPSTYMSTFDERVQFDGTNFYFIGPNAQAQYGRPVPITYGNPFHLGNNSPRPGSDLLSDLMNGIVFRYQTRYYISPLDLAIVQDCGITEAIPGDLKADFNRDGKPDYLLYNPGTRQTAVWYLNNSAFIGWAFAPTLPVGSRVIDAADFNRDGHPDYALFNGSTGQTAIWYFSGVNGVTFIGNAWGPRLPAGWELVATGQFNNEGKADFVIFNASTRQTAIWYLDNNVRTGGGYGPGIPAGWSLVGIADFNRDGKRDYLLFNPSTRKTAIWYLSGATRIGSAFGPTIAAGYNLVGTSDFNRDEKPDYLLFNPSTRQTAIWYMNNNVRIGTAVGPTLAAGYILAAP